MIAWPLVTLLALAGDAPVESSGGAGGLRLLVVPAAGIPSERVEAVYAALRDVGLAPVGLDERAGVDLPVDTHRPPRASLDDARAAVLGARAHYRALEMEQVGPALDLALDTMLRLEAPHAAGDLFADLLLLRAEVALVEGRVEAATRELVLLARLDRERAALDPGLYAPALVEAYAQARARDLEAPAGLLSVLPRVAGPSVPEVLLDGVLLPRGARERARPRAGPHLLTVRAEGVRTDARIIDVDERSPMELEPLLEPEAAEQERAAIVAEARAGKASEQALARLCTLAAAGAAVLVVDERPSLFVPARGLSPLAVEAAAEPLAIGRATLAVLRAPADDGAEETAVVEVRPVLIYGAIGAGVLLVAGLAATGVIVYQVIPFGVPEQPDPPHLFKCCK